MARVFSTSMSFVLDSWTVSISISVHPIHHQSLHPCHPPRIFHSSTQPARRTWRCSSVSSNAQMFQAEQFELWELLHRIFPCPTYRSAIEFTPGSSCFYMSFSSLHVSTAASALVSVPPRSVERPNGHSLFSYRA